MWPHATTVLKVQELFRTKLRKDSTPMYKVNHSCHTCLLSKFVGMVILSEANN